VVKPGDYEGLVKAVLYLGENHGAAEKWAERGRRHVENNLSVEKIGLKTKKLFEELT